MYWWSTNIKEQKNTNTPTACEHSGNRIWTSYTAGVTGKAQSHVYVYVCAAQNDDIARCSCVHESTWRRQNTTNRRERGKKCESFLSRARLLLHVFFLYISVCNFRFRCGLTAILFPFISFLLYIFLFIM